jgi:glycosyltransferase involved in cell wall biosynthesis
MTYHIIIPGHNAGLYAGKAINSARGQQGVDIRLILVDDASTDTTAGICDWFGQDRRCDVLHNDVRRGAAYSRWRAIVRADVDPEDVFVLLDMDDYLPHEHVLQRVDAEYRNGAQVTYGSYVFENGESWPQRAYEPGEDVTEATFWCTHLRTFKARLVEDIDPLWFIYNGEWIQKCTDVALMLPVMLAADPGTVRHIPDTLYVYRHDHPNVSRRVVPKSLRAEIEAHIRQKWAARSKAVTE